MSKEQEPLDAAYRRANAVQTEHPSMGTRQAILAQAAKIARQHTPAANDSRFVWRAVAGVAVLGVAVLVWRQVDHRMPGQAPQAVAVPEIADSAPMITARQEVPLEAAPAPEPRTLPPKQMLPAELASVDVQAPVAANESLAIAAEAAAPAAATERSAADSDRLEEVQVAGARSSRQSRPAAMAAAAREAQIAELLRDHFPTALQSGERLTVWLVRDSQGAVVVSGELGASQRLADVTKQLEPIYGASLGNWRTQTVTNDRNQSIVVAIAELRP